MEGVFRFKKWFLNAPGGAYYRNFTVLLLASILQNVECRFIIMPRGPCSNNHRWRVITRYDCTQSSFRFQYRLLTMTTFFEIDV